MTFRNRAADARLLHIERALRRVRHRLFAMNCREDAGDPTADTMPMHDEMARLIGEAATLHPTSDNGLASKARIVVANFELSEGGRALLYSLLHDLQARNLKRRF